MKNSGILGFIFGASIGAGVTWYAVKKYYESLATDEIEEMREYYNHLQDVMSGDGEPKTIDISGVNKTEYGKIENVKAEDKINYNEIIRKLNYNEYDNLDENSSKEEVEDALAETESPSEEDVDEYAPYVISMNEFVEEMDYDKITLTYYEEDEVFVNIEEEVVHEGLDLIGSRNLDLVGMQEDGVLYVRNPRFGADYEVIFNDGSYADFIANS